MLRGGGPIPPKTDALYYQVRILSSSTAAAAAHEQLLVGSTTLPFRVCVGIILSFLTCMQLLVAFSLVRNRNNSLLLLSQPIPLTLIVCCSSVATLSAYLFAFPENDVACASRQPIIFTSLSLIGALLTSRAWRIGSILSPAVDFASSVAGEKISDGGSSRGKVSIERTQSIAMGFMTRLSSFGRGHKHKSSTSNTGGKGMRRQVGIGQLLFVTFVLVIPQLTLQILNIFLPTIRTTSVNRPVVPFILGIMLTTFHFILALLFNSSPGRSSTIPAIFREYEKIKSSILIALTVLVITIPSMLMLSTEVPNLTAFLLTVSLLGLVLPLFHHIALSQFISMRTKSSDRINSKELLTSIYSSGSSPNKSNDHADKVIAAEEAMTMAKMLGQMGNYKASLDAYMKTLSLFKLEGKYSIQDGFSQKEIQSLSVKSLKVVVISLTTIGKMVMSQTSHKTTDGDASETQLGVKACLDALSVYESAPARKYLKDCSFIFPTFSIINQIVDLIKTDGMSQADYLLEIAIKFVSETEYQCFHHCRAVAMKATSLAKQLKFNEAVEAVKDMNRIYDPVKHGKIIAEEYATDHCCSTLALSAMWLKHLGREEEALVVCDNLARRFLPEIDKSNMLGRYIVIAPIIAIFKSSGRVERATELFTQFVVDPTKDFGKNWSSPAQPVIRPMALLLKVCSESGACDKLDEDIEWLLNGEEKVNERFNTIHTLVVQWSVYSLFAEVCLRIAEQLEKDDSRRVLLIKEGLRLSHLADPIMKNDSGVIIHPVAFSMHIVVLSELEELDDGRY